MEFLKFQKIIHKFLLISKIKIEMQLFIFAVKLKDYYATNILLYYKANINIKNNDGINAIRSDL